MRLSALKFLIVGYLAAWSGPTWGNSSDPGVFVSGQALSINGQTEIPRGLFGVHAMKITAEDSERLGIEAMRVLHPQGSGQPSSTGKPGTPTARLSAIVDCMFDRYVPALQLTDTNWEKRLTQLARDYGQAARDSGQTHYVEFWNEPYLNWATKPAVNYAAPLYRTERVKAGDPMTLKANGKEVRGLVWDREIFFVRNEDGTDINYVLSGYIPRTAVEGEPVTLGYGAGQATLTDGGIVRLRGKDHRVVKAWSGRDPGQKFYWSGPVNERLYNEMFGVYGKALKESNPAVKLAAGWGFNFYNENWEAWKSLIQPTLDKNHAWIDALHEHHYGGDTRMVAASYEVAYAYALSRYQRRLQFWNTEAGGHLDPQQPGNALPGSQGSPSVKATAAMTYLLRDIAYLLDRMPDKAVQRAAHEPQNNGGDLPAFGLLKPLRGRLMAVQTTVSSLWAAAAVEDQRLTVLLFNDASAPCKVPLNVKAPAGTTLTSATERRLLSESAAPWLRLEENTKAASGEVWEESFDLPGKSAVVFVFELSGLPTFTESIVRRQYVSPDVLVSLSGGGATDIEIPSGELTANRGILRLVLSDPGSTYSVVLNGQTLNPPSPASTIWDIPFPGDLIKEKNHLQLTSAEGKGMLLASSIYLETETKK